ncbi:L-aspartate oxidase [Rhodoblastus acidophilus]|uniref:L-aspartate oxidase n=1 Tax=Rhodoblastus acidophilus TaxID=1074 RepID=A0A212S093_RHOAC|nr:L-aspartate oxidase [Rhodoblastus acidophilus]PPQ38268.1 L-aspartate oxidase [Rhodoblastus acidophilus]RAI21795.1 L-aspartate oxidase [Rhodoblastus acidophilus]SNB78499.1 L-aspartate oxidase [Rhodoblastus acidophilus]
MPDILIVGGGLAGLFCALKLAPRPVTLLVAAPLGEGASSAWAQGGVAAAVLPTDSPDLHARDTAIAGAGIVDKDVALSVAREARSRIDDLLAFGAPFDRDAAGALVPSQEAAHSARRIVRVKGDGAGAAIMAALIARVRAAPSIEIVEGYVADDLIVREGRVAGVFARDPHNRLHAFMARAAILATGGVGALYALTTNPPQAAGSALAMGARAGARIADAEFVQFHPTAIDIGRDPAPLATEALRGEGAILVNRAGKRFMPPLHKDAELAPRDIVARGVFAEVAGGRGAFLDATQAVGAAFAEKFPNVAAACLEAGVDPAKQPIPVAPAEHYHMGGLWTDSHGRTSLPGLWAAGESGSTGLHGANRLASNSLLEAVVYAARAAADVSAALPSIPDPGAAPAAPPAFAPDAAGAREIRQIMQRHVGVLREASGLRAALIRLLALRDKAVAADNLDLRNRAEAALLIAAAAYNRRESRGGHFRTDFPQADPAQAQRSFISLEEALSLSRDLADEKSNAFARA